MKWIKPFLRYLPIGGDQLTPCDSITRMSRSNSRPWCLTPVNFVILIPCELCETSTMALASVDLTNMLYIKNCEKRGLYTY